MKKKVLIVLIIATAALYSGCASSAQGPTALSLPTSEAHLLTTPPEETAFVSQPLGWEEKRQLYQSEVVPYGDVILISNQTGAAISFVDLFSSFMYESSDTQENYVNNQEFWDGQELRIHLSDHPLLQQALLEKQEQQIVLNATDVFGNSYFKLWNPASESWKITISYTDMESSYEATTLQAEEGTLLIANVSGFSFVEISLFPNTNMQEGIPIPLVSELHSGHSLRVPLALIDEQSSEYYIRATDNEGDYFTEIWHPEYDVPLIIFTLDSYYWSVANLPPKEGELKLFVKNESDSPIFYLYLVSQQQLAEGDYGYDLLGSSVLESDKGLWFDPLNLGTLDDYFYSGSDEDLILVVENWDDEEFYILWNPYYDEWEITLINDEQGEPLLETSAPKEISVNFMTNLQEGYMTN